MKTYLEYKDDTSNKFWEIDVVGNKQIITFGKIGTNGQTQEKEFSNSEEAEKEAKKLIDSKIKKGYVSKDQYKSKNIIIQEIEKVLRTQYQNGYGYSFLGRNGFDDVRNNFTIEQFKNQIKLELPPLFYEFYEWLLNVDFPKKDLSKKINLEDHSHNIFSLKEILDETVMWQDIQKENEKREWKSGFVALCSWGSAYQMVIDTKGEINNKKGCIAFWDYKGGSDYWVTYPDFEKFLLTKLELLKEKIYFPPAVYEDEIDDDDGEIVTYEDFCYGAVKKDIDAIIEIINGKTEIISF